MKNRITIKSESRVAISVDEGQTWYKLAFVPTDTLSFRCNYPKYLISVVEQLPAKPPLVQKTLSIDAIINATLVS